MRQSTRVIRHHLLTVAVWVSVCLLVISVVQAVRSLRGQGFHDVVVRHDFALFFTGSEGHFTFGVSVHPHTIIAPSIRMENSPNVALMGFRFERIRLFVGGTVVARTIAVSLYAWQAMILSGLLPAAWFVKLRRRRTAQLGEHICEICGYDLRATPERCPECGTVQDSIGIGPEHAKPV
jgi:hypothetical protein